MELIEAVLENPEFREELPRTPRDASHDRRRTTFCHGWFGNGHSNDDGPYDHE